jgi:hypothetical protein
VAPRNLLNVKVGVRSVMVKPGEEGTGTRDGIGVPVCFNTGAGVIGVRVGCGV